MEKTFRVTQVSDFLAVTYTRTSLKEISDL